MGASLCVPSQASLALALAQFFESESGNQKSSLCNDLSMIRYILDSLSCFTILPSYLTSMLTESFRHCPEECYYQPHRNTASILIFSSIKAFPHGTAGLTRLQ